MGFKVRLKEQRGCLHWGTGNMETYENGKGGL